MPIPRYDSPQVGIASTQGARINPSSAPNPMGAIGQGLGQAVEGFSGIVQQAETLRAEEALNQLRSKQQEYTGWVQELKGKNAFDPGKYGGEEGASLQKTALGWFDAAAQEVAKGLSPHAQKVFKSGADRFRLEFDGHIQHHEARETAAVASDTYKGALVVEDQNISQNAVAPDGRIQMDTITQSINRKVYAANQLSEFLGESPDMRQARELDARSGAHALVLDSLLKQNNAQGARAYFDMNKGQMDSRVTSFMAGKIQQSILANDVQAKAQELDRSGLGLEDQLAKVDELSKGNPEFQKALSSEVEHRFQIRKTAERVEEQETIGKLWDMRYPTLPGSKALPMSQIMKTPEWNSKSLDGAKRNQLIEQWKSYAKRDDNNPKQIVDQYLAYYNARNDENFINFTDDQIRSLQGELGPQLTVQLMKDLQHVRSSPKKVDEVRLDSHIVDAAARKFGVISGDAPTRAEKAAVGKMQAQAMRIIQASGREWDYDNQVKLFEHLSQKVVTDRGWFSDAETPLFELLETVAIPKNFINAVKARAAALRQPEPTDDATLYQLWFDARDKGLVDEQGNPVAKGNE